MNRSYIAACFLLLAPFAASCVTPDEETTTADQMPPDEETTTADQTPPDELGSDEHVRTTEQASLLGDTCRNTDIFITNSVTLNDLNRAIRVRYVEYYSASEGKWYTEDLTNLVVNFGAQGFWWDEDLAHAENDLITKWKVHFDYASGGSWVPAVPQVIDTPDTTCLAGTNFYMTVQ